MNEALLRATATHDSVIRLKIFLASIPNARISLQSLDARSPPKSHPGLIRRREFDQYLATIAAGA